MTDFPLTGEDKVRRGLRATELLADPLILEAMATIEAMTIGAWRNEDNPEKREKAWYLLRAMEIFKGMLADIVTTGRMAEDKAERNG
jgi:hypothetical protein